MIEYKLFFDGSGICAKRDGHDVTDTLTLSFSGEGEKHRLGIISDGKGERFFNITDSKTEISASSLDEGENRLTVYGKNKRWRCEPLVREENRIYCGGVDSAEEIMHFKSEYEKIYATLALCEARLHALEEKTSKAFLF